jgi:acyl-CoA thioester hydrolase
VNSHSEIQVRVPIRWRDLDAYGHVNNAVFLTYLEEARDKLVQELFGDQAWDFVLARVAIDYRQELTQEDREVVVRAGVAGYGRASVRTWERVEKPDGSVSAESESVIVPRDPEGSAGRPLTDQERGRLDRAIGSDDSA